MKLSHFTLNKPEYIFRPSQIVRRILGGNGVVRFPWKVTMTVSKNETIGRSIINTGFHDLTVTESIFRLLDEGEIAVDAGANIGYFTLLMNKRVGSRGSVRSFEPHPGIYKKLKANVSQNGVSNVTLFEMGLSSGENKGFLFIPDSFGGNEGVASVSFTQSKNSIDIKLTTLDDVCSESIGVLKIDVEGHELDALRGASKLLLNNKIRDIVFEDHNRQPSEVVNYLLSFGYSIYRLEKQLLKPRLHDFAASLKVASWETPNFIATKDPARLKERFKSLGWRCI